MDRKIKTRQVHKDIKVLDKTVTVTDHVKQSYVRNQIFIKGTRKIFLSDVS